MSDNLRRRIAELEARVQRIESKCCPDGLQQLHKQQASAESGPGQPLRWFRYGQPGHARSLGDTARGRANSPGWGPQGGLPRHPINLGLNYTTAQGTPLFPNLTGGPSWGDTT
jgi:hypothetical protein